MGINNELLKKQKDTYCSIEQYLKYNLDIHMYDTVSSTNTLLKEMAVQGAPEGTIIIADSQTDGRGRMGKSFHSPAGTGIYLSILLRPDFPASESLFLTTSVAVAVAKAIEDVSDKKAEIKWVNDIYISEKKVCGILTEAAFNSETEKLDYAIVGIGINLTLPDDGFPEDISNIATTIFDKDSYSNDNRNLLIANLLNYFMDYYHNFSSKKYVTEYINRSMIIGKEISVINNSKTVDATALDIDTECRLKVRYSDGFEEWINSGDVSIKVHN